MQRQSQPQGRDTDGIQDSVEKRREAKGCCIDFLLFFILLFFLGRETQGKDIRHNNSITSLPYHYNLFHLFFSFYPLTFFLNPACFFLFLWTLSFFCWLGIQWVFFFLSFFLIHNIRHGLGWAGLGEFFYYRFLCVCLHCAPISYINNQKRAAGGHQRESKDHELYSRVCCDVMYLWPHEKS